MESSCISIVIIIISSNSVRHCWQVHLMGDSNNTVFGLTMTWSRIETNDVIQEAMIATSRWRVVVKTGSISARRSRDTDRHVTESCGVTWQRSRRRFCRAEWRSQDCSSRRGRTQAKHNWCGYHSHSSWTTTTEEMFLLSTCSLQPCQCLKHEQLDMRHYLLFD